MGSVLANVHSGWAPSGHSKFDPVRELLEGQWTQGQAADTVRSLAHRLAGGDGNRRTTERAGLGGS